ncbi:MAG: glycosyltransferase [Cytophagales bacterium]|nr:glycosyltransferase [Cytophagales bacterium]
MADGLFLLVQGLYCLFTLLLWAAWRRIPAPAGVATGASRPFFSVVVAARDEAGRLPDLLRSLARQDYPRESFEVLVVDDHSTDDTARVVTEAAAVVRFPLRLLRLADYLPASPGGSNYKKKAIEYGVQSARGNWIVLTDGDCRVPTGWLTALAGCARQTGVQMVSGPVAFDGERSAFEQMQTVEFASLIGSGAATLQLGLPTMCNAANLAFAREAFAAVDGYAGTADTATGDDLFLMHKVYRRYPGGVVFLKSPGGVVYTRAKETWGAFYQQRKRWASKWSLYQDWRVPALAVAIFAANVSLPAGLAGYLAGGLSGGWLLLGVAARFAGEFAFLRDVLRFLGRGGQVRWIVPVQLVYAPYVIFFAIIAQKRGYVWKGRKLY